MPKFILATEFTDSIKNLENEHRILKQQLKGKSYKIWKSDSDPSGQPWLVLTWLTVRVFLTRSPSRSTSDVNQSQFKFK